MSDNISHGQQQDEWKEWIDWMESEDWTCLDWDDTSVVTQPVDDHVTQRVGRPPGSILEPSQPETRLPSHQFFDPPPGDALEAGRCTTTLASMTTLSTPVLVQTVDCVQPQITSCLGVADEGDNLLDPIEHQVGPAVARLPATVRQAARVATRHCKRANHKALHCTVDGCTYEGTFPRAFELHRHINSKHGGPKEFICPVKGCFKGPNPWTFARHDKLTSHIRSVHRLDDEVQCLTDQCDALLPLDLLGRHLKFAHYSNYTIQRQAIINAANPRYRKCPIPQCSKPLTLEVFIGHLEFHNQAELESIRAVLNLQGYIFTLSVTDGRIKVEIACPVTACSTLSGSHQEFNQHLFSSHIVAQNAVESVHMGMGAGMIVHTGSRSAWLNLGPRGVSHCLLCNRTVYPFEKTHSCKAFIKRGAVKELGPHRQALLRLCPDFGKFKVFFDDL